MRMRVLLLITTKGVGYNFNRCGMILELGSKFLHPRPEMMKSTSKVLCPDRSKEVIGFFLMR
jgi:hypothetical protein